MTLTREQTQTLFLIFFINTYLFLQNKRMFYLPYGPIQTLCLTKPPLNALKEMFQQFCQRHPPAVFLLVDLGVIFLYI